jgi:dienelactone hydrolase
MLHHWCQTRRRSQGRAQDRQRQYVFSPSQTPTTSTHQLINSQVPAYITFPESKDTSTAIIILPDVIGHEFINAQLIADQFAANGYYVVMPDLFQGDPVKLNPAEGFDIMNWLQKGGPEGKGHLPDSVDPIVEKTLAYMKEQGAKKIGAVGYCFGGKYVARFLAKGKGVDVGYTAHPSFVDEDEIKGMAGPLSIAAAGTFHTSRTIRRVIINQILQQRPTISSPKTSATRPSSSSRK